MLRNLIVSYKDAIKHNHITTTISDGLMDALLNIYNDSTITATGKDACFDESVVFNDDDLNKNALTTTAVDDDVDNFIIANKPSNLAEIKDSGDAYDNHKTGIINELKKRLFDELQSINLVSNTEVYDDIRNAVLQFNPPQEYNDLKVAAISQIQSTLLSDTLPKIKEQQQQQKMRAILSTLNSSIQWGEDLIKLHPSAATNTALLTACQSEFKTLKNEINIINKEKFITQDHIEKLKKQSLTTADNIKRECKKNENTKDLYTRFSEWANDIRYKIFGAGNLSMRCTLFKAISDTTCIAKIAIKKAKLVMSPQKK